MTEQQLQEIEDRADAWYDDERNRIDESATQFCADIGSLLHHIGALELELRRLTERNQPQESK